MGTAWEARDPGRPFYLPTRDIMQDRMNHTSPPVTDALVTSLMVTFKFSGYHESSLMLMHGIA
jgi:hypothetical protein